MPQKTFVATALFCAALACKNGSPAPAPTLPDTCSSDTECQAGFRCDREQRRCVCTGDDACPGKFCNAFTGLCVDTIAGCTSDAACGAGQVCDRALRTCKPVTPFCQPCHANAQCGAGSKCAPHPQYPQAGTFCVPLCAAPAGGGSPGCANGLTCLAATSGDKLCYPSTGACGQSNACVPDSLKLCLNGDGDCDAAQACDKTLRQCVARVRTCPAGDACDPQSKLCARACGSDADCAVVEGKPGYLCRANACFLRALCNGDGDCSPGQTCTANPDGSKSCRQGCVTASDCPLGQGCSQADPNHPRCLAGCTQNVDCPVNTVCLNGACAGSNPPACAQTCQTTAACPVGAYCQNNCCVGLDFNAACQPGDAPGASPSKACPACIPGRGCTQSCQSSCFPLTLGACNSQNDCVAQGYPPDVICNTTPGIQRCQVLGHLQSCADTVSSSDCPAKGFRCVSASQFGCGTGGGICFPYEAAAQASCALGHN